ncbi:MAG: winged helix DNA-binding protein [Clostridia bacterium]|nr:winged helix DNA-binding protein [Clostridia bacterium]
MDYEKTAETIIATVEDAAILKIEHDYSRLITGENLVLYCIYKSGGKALPKNLCRITGVSSARIAAVLNRLEAGGLVRRSIDTEDNRQTVVALTGDGQARAISNHETVLRRTSALLSYLGETDTLSLLKIVGKIKMLSHVILQEGPDNGTDLDQ